MILSRRLTLCLAIAWLSAGCAGPPKGVLFGAGRKDIAASDYSDILSTWTRAAKVYSGLDYRLSIKATFHSPEFRRAFAIAFPEIYGHGGDITRRELVDLTGDVEQYHTFFVSMYTPDPSWNDLDKSDSIWRVTLIGKDGVSVGPKEIIPVKIDENLRAVYSSIDRFDKAYLVRFPLSDPMRQILVDPQTSSFSMHVGSALGRAALRWDLASSEPGQQPDPTSR